MGIVYLIQPIELVGTDRYKIGCSTKSDLSRITTGYNKGTIPNLVEVVDDPYFVETLLKQAFAERFTLIGGREFFSGDIHQMEACFKETTSKTKPSKIYIKPVQNESEKRDGECVQEDVVVESKFQCSKCNKHFKSKKGWLLHEPKCVGLNSRQCPTCFKVFATSQSKYNHVHYVKCKPPETISPASINIETTFD